MIRDVTDRGFVHGVRTTFVCLVYDVEAEVVRGAQISATARKAVKDAMAEALTSPAGPMPVEIRCDLGYSGQVEKALAGLLKGAPLPPLIELVPPDQAENVLDALLGRLAGRQQPLDVPMADDWTQLTASSLQFRHAEPWHRWSDVDKLSVIVETDGHEVEYTAIVIGRGAVQRGLNLFPGDEMPIIGDWRPGEPFPMPVDTLIFYLDPIAGATPEHAGKALRYGWPDGADLWPSWFVVGDEGPADLDRVEVHLLALALAGIARHIPGGQPTFGMLPPTGTFSIAG
jgi:hypothetical protein